MRLTQLDFLGGCPPSPSPLPIQTPSQLPLNPTGTPGKAPGSSWGSGDDGGWGWGGRGGRVRERLALLAQKSGQWIPEPVARESLVNQARSPGHFKVQFRQSSSF